MSDHRPLQWIFSLAKPTGRLARWQLELAQYKLSVKYIEGQLNKVADALSRIKAELAEEDEGDQYITLISQLANDSPHPFLLSIDNEVATLLSLDQLSVSRTSQATLVRSINALQQHTPTLNPPSTHPSPPAAPSQSLITMKADSPPSVAPTTEVQASLYASGPETREAFSHSLGRRKGPAPFLTGLTSIEEEMESEDSAEIVNYESRDSIGFVGHTTIEHNPSAVHQLSNDRLYSQLRTVTEIEPRSIPEQLQQDIISDARVPQSTLRRTPLSHDNRQLCTDGTGRHQSQDSLCPQVTAHNTEEQTPIRRDIPALEKVDAALVLAGNNLINVNVILAPEQGSLLCKFTLHITSNAELDLNEHDIPNAQLSDRICQLLTKFKDNSLAPAERKELAKVMKHFDKFQYDIIDGILYRISPQGERVLHQVYVPSAIRSSFLAFGHIKCGHGGKDTTFDCLQTFAFWESMHKDIQNHISACLICIQFKGKYGPRAPVLKFNNTSQAFERTHADLVGPLEKSSEGFLYILTVIDSLTRFVITVPLRSKKAKEVADAFFRHVIVPHGTVKTLITDSGLEFINGSFKTLADALKMRHYTTPIYHPQSNGMVERANQSIVTILRSLVAANPKTWAKMLPHATIAYNQAFHHSIGDSPYFLLHLRDPPHPIPALDSTPANPQVVNLLKYRELTLAAQQKAYARVQAFLDKDYKQREKLHRRTHTPNITLGSRVYIYRAPTPHVSTKLQPRYKGPFRVIKVNNNTLIVRSLVSNRRHKVHLDNVKLVAENQLSEADHPAVRRAFPTKGEDLSDSETGPDPAPATEPAASAATPQTSERGIASSTSTTPSSSTLTTPLPPQQPRPIRRAARKLATPNTQLPNDRVLRPRRK